MTAAKPKGSRKLKTPMPRGSRLSTPITPETTRGKGRPTLYRPEMAQQVTNMCLLGLTDEELAVSFGVDVVTLDGWKREFADFSMAIRAGREGADETVARALYLKACGYEHPEDDIRTITLPGLGSGSEIVITPTIKRYAPDVRAAQIWLNNRQRKRWKFGDGEATGFDAATLAGIMRAMHEMAEEDE